jgi:hypothetical protein
MGYDNEGKLQRDNFSFWAISQQMESPYFADVPAFCPTHLLKWKKKVSGIRKFQEEFSDYGLIVRKPGY